MVTTRVTSCYCRDRACDRLHTISSNSSPSPRRRLRRRFGRRRLGRRLRRLSARGRRRRLGRRARVGRLLPEPRAARRHPRRPPSAPSRPSRLKRRPVGRRGPLRTMRAARHCEAEPVAGRAAACAEDWSRGHGWCRPAGGCAQEAGRAPGGNYRWRPVEAGQASAEPQRARTRARRRAADQRRRRWTQRALTGPSGPTATSRHARPGQAAGPARRSVGRRADLEAGGRPGSRPGGVRWWSGCVGRSVPDGADDAQAPSPEDGLRSCRPVEEAAPVRLTCARVWVGAL